MVAQKITKDDIKYITNNLLPILSDLIPEESREQMEQLKKILSIEALTIMQLIGFNYKKAIGEPLTLVLQKMIESKIPADSKANIDYALLMARIALDEKSTERYCKLTNKKLS